MRSIAEALSSTEGTRSRLAKVDALAAALADVAARHPERLAFVARFFTGVLVAPEWPAGTPELGVGGALVFDAACAVTGATPPELGAGAGKSGDLGTATGAALEVRLARDTAAGRPPPPGLPLAAAAALGPALAHASTRAEKLATLTEALEACTPLEARYLVRALLGEMRVGARGGIVEDAIAKAFCRPRDAVRTAAAVVLDPGELAVLAHEGRLADARLRLGRPVAFMLATPIETARGADLSAPHVIEDKIDGIRAQAHVSPDGVWLFARGTGSVTAAFPDVTGPLLEAVHAGQPPAIVDGELVVVGPDGAPRPFSAIQPRLKKTAPDEELVREHPVRYLVYDLLFEAGEDLLALPFRERRERLLAWAAKAPPPIVVNAARPLVTRAGAARDDITALLDREYDDARSRGFEGLVLKRLDAPYAAGVRGFSWLKVKKALATLDVVVVGAEYGHGKRAGVLSDYTFAVRDGDRLRTIGRAYSGLTDVEIADMTARLLALVVPDGDRTGQRPGFLPVRPEIVLEIAFDGLQRSDRHTSGFALRFPRIARVRDDKRPDEADTIDAVEALWNAQLASGHREDRVAKDRQPASRGRRSGRRPDVRRATKQLRLFDDD